MLHQLENLVQNLALEEHQPLGSLAYSSSWDLKQSLVWNSEEVADVVESTIHERVAEQAKIQPHTIALRSREGQLTYQELNDMSDQLASHLVKSNMIQPHDLVHVCFEKSLWHFVSILAINKARGAWVPLDPSYPAERLRQIVDQTGARLALVSSQHAELCSGLVNTTLEITPQFLQNLDAAITINVQSCPRDPVYVLFTSGSTGTPKGLVMEHGAVCTAMTAIAKRTGLTSEVNMLQFAAFVFDLSIGEIIGPLITGATISIPSDHDRTNDISSFIAEFEVTWAYLTPSFTRTLEPPDVPSLELLLWAGEAVSRDIFETWFGHVRLLNGWGPAETCCFSTIHEWKSLDDSHLTVGKPVGGFCWIVEPNDHARLAPIGTVGEVVIQGPTILREYLANPEKTALSITNSLPEWAPSRILPRWDRFYKSGDLCRYNQDGTIEFCSRKDTQVKIRGMRVELGEIEHNIQTRLAGVGQVVADVLSSNQLSQLVLYFTLEKEVTADGKYERIELPDMFMPLESDLQAQLAAVLDDLRLVLPRYMIPSLFIHCRWMPLIGASKKLDRSSLRRQAEALGQKELDNFSLVGVVATRRAPETQTEKELQKIWASVLDVPEDSIGTGDGFYHISGDSIGIIKLAKQIEKRLNITCSSLALSNNHSTISAMARLIDGSSDSIKTLDLASEIQSITDSLETSFSRLSEMPFSPHCKEMTVLLTGASGYLGTEILRQLLDSDDVVSVVAHVRAKSEIHGLERIQDAAKISGWWSPRYMEKLEVWVGDLHQDRVGLTDAQWDRVCGLAPEGNVNSIIHNGASVNWNLDYNSLRQMNVGSTMALLEASILSPVKAKFVFVSGGLSLVDVSDVDSLIKGMRQTTGYVQTKFVADLVFKKLFSQLPESQNRVAVVKPGRIMGNKDTGVANTDDYLWRMVAGAVSMGSYPTCDTDQWISLADVSTISNLIIGKLSAFTYGYQAFEDIVLGISTRQFWELVNIQLDTPCTPMRGDDWNIEVTKRLETVGDRHPLWSVQDFIASSLGMIRPESGTNDEADAITEHLSTAIVSNVAYLKAIRYLQPVLETYEKIESNVVKRSAVF